MARRKAFKFKQVKEFGNYTDGSNYLDWGKDKTQTDLEFFKQIRPLVLELGCGYGEYTTGMAEIFPTKNFLGVDIKSDRLWKGAKFSLENNLSNAVFLRSDIKQIPAFIKDNSVSQIWITFPDPQPTKPKKRLLYKDFLDIYFKLLEPNGKLFLKTDNRDFFDYALLQIQNYSSFKMLNSSFDLYSSKLQDKAFDVKTRYEKKFSELGFKICFLEAQKSTI